MRPPSPRTGRETDGATRQRVARSHRGRLAPASLPWPSARRPPLIGTAARARRGLPPPWPGPRAASADAMPPRLRFQSGTLTPTSAKNSHPTGAGPGSSSSRLYRGPARTTRSGFGSLRARLSSRAHPLDRRPCRPQLRAIAEQRCQGDVAIHNRQRLVRTPGKRLRS